MTTQRVGFCQRGSDQVASPAAFIFCPSKKDFLFASYQALCLTVPGGAWRDGLWDIESV